jgi:hypothetical protein
VLYDLDIIKDILLLCVFVISSGMVLIIPIELLVFGVMKTFSLLYYSTKIK